ncbi:MAG: diguanylate cyclase [Candidatus Frackibacter sp. T328-2]|nr:MAG: diguanylate cyclase [Candidatus Frackibacter sp. T328-2]
MKVKLKKQTESRITKTKYFLIAISILALLLTTVSFYFWLKNIKKQYYNLQIKTSKSLLAGMKALRIWNASHNGVYVPKTEKVSPNPYLPDESKVVITKNGQELTKINAAYMTRMVSKIMKQKSNIGFHLTSLKPINPQNFPDQWEMKMLKGFRNIKKLKAKVTNLDGQLYFRYMEPLITKESCLQCHAQQGYQVGDIRGGVSVSFPYQQDIIDQNIKSIFWWHFLILIGVLNMIYLLGTKLLKYIKKEDEYKKKLENIARYDELTGLLNRRSLMANLKEEFSKAEKYNTSLAVIMYDLDHFKDVNDTYGHNCGDLVLKEVSQTVKDEVRQNDIVGRLGGEEFLLILPNTDGQNAIKVAEKCRKAIEEMKINYKENKIKITASFGVTEVSNSIDTTDELLNIVDKNMYEAKSSGRNKVYSS